MRGVRGRLHVHQGNDVLVVEEAQQLDLAQRALRVHRVHDGVLHLLDRDLEPGLRVAARADDAVGSLSDRLDQRVLVLRGDLTGLTVQATAGAPNNRKRKADGEAYHTVAAAEPCTAPRREKK